MVADRDRDRYRKVILQRSKHPLHHGRLESHDAKGYAVNPICGDVVEVTLALSKDGLSIARICHMSDGCAVCIASADLMVDMVTGQAINQVQGTAHTFKAMLNGQTQLADSHPLASLSPLAHLPGRARCAGLGWDALEQATKTLKSFD
jgi:nitrogen fixation NifU-like protein